ncbi:hypothetical protein [uncultured Sulfitobacter sp.]|uniref:hypothetical protein n=1 Tax=uncultured Sulfitobacter sp. TaxID=191468 RepID=UPI002610D168|nr:hypothetical protein [uncultured Sulfitobacter sp.]
MSQSDLIGQGARSPSEPQKVNRVDLITAFAELSPCADFSLERMLDRVQPPVGRGQ